MGSSSSLICSCVVALTLLLLLLGQAPGCKCLYGRSKIPSSEPPAVGIDLAGDHETRTLKKRILRRSLDRPSGLTADDIENLMWRCMSNDTKSSYRVFPDYQRFENSTVIYRIDSYTSDLSPCATRNVLKRAFRVWEEVAEITFIEDSNAERPDMKIEFAYGDHNNDNFIFDGQDGWIAHAFPAGDVHFDDAELWTYGKGRVYTRTFRGNSDGASCAFPFVYEGREYKTCLPVENMGGLEWCATTHDFDRDGKYGLCENEYLLTYGGTGGGRPCKFPFEYKNRTITECVERSEQDLNFFCATSSNYQEDDKWGYCPYSINMTVEGNSGNDECYFPFYYGGKYFHECTTAGRDDDWAWCSTTPNYDQDLKYSFCDNGYSLFLVAAHEIGHTLGLNHTDNCLALMYNAYAYMEDFSLHEADIEGVRVHYGPRLSDLAPLQLEECTEDLSYNSQALNGGKKKVSGPQQQQTTTTAAPSTTTTTSVASTTTTTTTTTERPATSTTTTMAEPEQPSVVTTRRNKPKDGTRKASSSLVKSAKKTEMCEMKSVDAVFTYRGFTFLFRGRKVWKWNMKLGHIDGPYEISRAFHNGPDRVDAAYVRPFDDKLVLFKGNQYWECEIYTCRYGSVPLAHYGFPKKVKKIDAAINWNRSHRRWTTFFVGDRFYSYHEEDRRMIFGNPKKYELWNAELGAVTAAMEDPWNKKKSILFLGRKAWKVVNYRISISERTHFNTVFDC